MKRWDGQVIFTNAKGCYTKTVQVTVEAVGPAIAVARAVRQAKQMLRRGYRFERIRVDLVPTVIHEDIETVEHNATYQHAAGHHE